MRHGRPSERGDGASPLAVARRSATSRAAREDRAGPFPLPNELRCQRRWAGGNQGGTARQFLLRP